MQTTDYVVFGLLAVSCISLIYTNFTKDKLLIAAIKQAESYKEKYTELSTIMLNMVMDAAAEMEDFETADKCHKMLKEITEKHK